MLKINTIFKNSRKYFSKNNRNKGNKNRDNKNIRNTLDNRDINKKNENQEKSNIFINEKLNFFLKEDKPFNFVDYYISNNQEEKLKKIDTNDILEKIENSLDNKIVKDEIINLSQNLFYFYNSPNTNKIIFKENFKKILDKLELKNKDFFSDKSNRSFLLKIFSFALKINLNYKIVHFSKITKEINLEKTEKNILINSIYNYLNQNTKLMDNLDIEINLNLFENFIDLIKKENLTKMFQKNIDRFFLLISSYLVNEKFESFNYLDNSIKKMEDIIIKNKRDQIFNEFDLVLYKFFIKCDYNLNEELFILDSINFNNIKLQHILTIFETKDNFDKENIDIKKLKEMKEIKENQIKIVQYYGKKYFQIKNRALISKEYYKKLQIEFKNGYKETPFYIISLFANKFNDLEFFIDNQDLLKTKENVEKMNFFYLNCLIKNVKKGHCLKIITSTEINFWKCSKLDRKIIQTIIDMKETNKKSTYHNNFLMEDLKKNILRNLVAAFKIYYPEQDFQKVIIPIKNYINQIPDKTVIKLGFDVFTDKKNYLKEFCKQNKIDIEAYFQILGFTMIQYYGEAEDKIKYSEYFRGKSVFFPLKPLSLKESDDFAIEFNPLIGEDMKSGRIKNFNELTERVLEVKNILDKEEEEKNKAKLADEKKEKEIDIDIKMEEQEIRDNEYIESLSERDRLIHEEHYDVDGVGEEEQEGSVYQKADDEDLDEKKEVEYSKEWEKNRGNKGESRDREEIKEEFLEENEEEDEEGDQDEFEEDGEDFYYEFENLPLHTHLYNRITKKVDNIFIPEIISRYQKNLTQFESITYKGIFSGNSEETDGTDINRYVEKVFDMDIHNDMMWYFIDHKIDCGIQFGLKVQHFLGKEFDDFFLQKKLKDYKFIVTENDSFEYKNDVKFSIDIANSPFFNDTIKDFENDYIMKSFLKKHQYIVDRTENEEIISKAIN